MTLGELQERQNKGFYFHCDEKYGLGHQCKGLFLIEGCWVEEEHDLSGIQEDMKLSL